MGPKKAETKHLARLRAKLQQLSQLLYWQWTLRFDAFGKGEGLLDRAAVIAGEETTQFIRDLREEFGWVPYKIISRDVVVVQHLGIRCEPNRAVPVEPQPAQPKKSPARPFVGRIGWTGATKPGQYVPSARVPAPSMSSQGTGRGMRPSGRGMGLWRWPSVRVPSAPLPSARAPIAPSSAVSRQNSVRGRGLWRRPTVPTSPTTEPGQCVARGGRFFD